MKKYEKAEELIKNNQLALLENKDMLLLYARTQDAQNKVEAVDSYARWLVENKDPKVNYEYARVLEKAELYARALEEYRTSLAALAQDSKEPAKAEVRFAIARLIFIADPENPEGFTELRGALADGYNDTEALEELVRDERIDTALRGEIKAVIDDPKRAAPAEKTETEEAETGTDDAD
jgi:hypothetical protein